MKKLILILILFQFTNAAQAYSFNQYNGQVSQQYPSSQQNITKVYDNKGRYQGRLEKNNTTTKVYDSKGFYQYSFVQPVSR